MSTEDPRIRDLRTVVEMDVAAGLPCSMYATSLLAALLAAYDDRGRQIKELKILLASNHSAYLNAIGVTTTPEKPEVTK